VYCSTMAHRHCAWPYEPQGVTSAQMSLFYTLAVMAHDGEVLIGKQFSEQRLSDPALLDFMKRIHIEVDPRFDEGADASRHQSRVKVVTRDGRELERYAQYRKGSPHNPMTEDERYGKFRTLAGASLPDVAVERLITEFNALERTDVGTLIGLLQGK